MEPGLPEGPSCHWRRLPAPGQRPAEQGQDRLEGGDEVVEENGEFFRGVLVIVCCCCCCFYGIRFNAFVVAACSF